MLRLGSFRTVLTTALFITLAFSLAPAQASHTGLKYDRTQEVRVKGVVDEIHIEKYQELVLTLAPDAATRLGAPKVIVQVAPDAFLKEMGISFAQGEQIEVLGSKVVSGTDTVIMVKEISRASGTLEMRDDQGIPVWQGWNPMKHDE